MSQLIHIHVQYSGRQTAMKVRETYRIKSFYSYKTTQWSRISQKSPLPEPEFNLESFSFLLETRLAVELFTSG